MRHDRPSRRPAHGAPQQRSARPQAAAAAWLRRLLLLALAAFVLAPAAQAGTYTVVASRDSFIKQAATSENNGTITDLMVKTNSSGADRHRAIYGWTLPTIPANEMIVSVTVRFWVTQLSDEPVHIHRVTDSWTEATVTWANTASDYATPAVAQFRPSNANTFATATITDLVKGWYAGTYANNGVMLLGAANADTKLSSRERANAAQRPELVITTGPAPQLSVTKVSTLLGDPVNWTSNPRAIPGAVVLYTVTASNSANGAADANTLVITDAVPPAMKLYVGDINGNGSGPMDFTDGSPSSGLTYSYAGLANGGDSLSFSNDGGHNYTYAPVPDQYGFDPAVTHVRINPAGAFAAKTGGSNPSFTLRMAMQVR